MMSYCSMQVAENKSYFFFTYSCIVLVFTVHEFKINHSFFILSLLKISFFRYPGYFTKCCNQYRMHASFKIKFLFSWKGSEKWDNTRSHRISIIDRLPFFFLFIEVTSSCVQGNHRGSWEIYPVGHL